MINNVTLVGRLTKDPELQYMNGNKDFCQFTIAVNRNYKNANGEYDADFINCSVFGKSAEYLTNYCFKGNLIGITGSIRTNKKQNIDGSISFYTNVNVNNLCRLEKNTNNNVYGQVENTYNSYGSIGVNPNNQVDLFGDLNDINEHDLPF